MPIVPSPLPLLSPLPISECWMSDSPATYESPNKDAQEERPTEHAATKDGISLASVVPTPKLSRIALPASWDGED
eukprot:4767928-Alexandrium_andersonii.AAC.1